MKLTNFKMYSLMIAVSVFLALSGCGGGTTSNSTTPMPDAATSTVTANPALVAADGTEVATVTVTVNDANSNPITNATVTLSQGTGSSTISTVNNVGDGTYTFDVNSTTAETITYTATADGVTITQTADVTFEPGTADADTSTVVADPTSVSADGISTSTITVTVMDANSNPITDANVTLGQGGGASTISDVNNTGDGTYTFEVNSTTAETVTYTAIADNVTITQTDDVTFVSVGAADADTSTVTADPTSVSADGTSISTITVTVKDVNSNPITDANVTLDQGGGASTISNVTNEGDGTYTFEVNSTTVETVIYTATADGVTITQTADVDFILANCLNTAGYGTIEINGRTWLDRNLGASEAAADTNDSAARGDLYQWGRSADGHQVRDPLSDINDTLATTLDNVQGTDWEGKFIVGANDWAVTTLDNNGSIRSLSWSTPYDEITNPNQVCPCGYVVPTIQEFLDINMTAPNATDTFKLTNAGWRENIDGNVTQESSRAYFWTTTTVGPNRSTVYAYFTSSDSEARYDITKRANGYSIRCIKPQ